jgi:hypothetical protein
LLYSNNVREDYHLNDGQGGVHGTTGSLAVRTHSHSPKARSDVVVVSKSASVLKWWTVAVVVELINDDLAGGSSLLRVDSGVLQ